MAHLSARDSMKGTMREGFFTGYSERYVQKGSEMGAAFTVAPLMQNPEGCLFLRDFLLEEFS